MLINSMGAPILAIDAYNYLFRICICHSGDQRSLEVRHSLSEMTSALKHSNKTEEVHII